MLELKPSITYQNNALNLYIIGCVTLETGVLPLVGVILEGRGGLLLGPPLCFFQSDRRRLHTTITNRFVRVCTGLPKIAQL